VKPSGPDHANVDPGNPVAVKLSEPPEHTGELLPNIGVGVTFIDTIVEAVLVHVPILTVTEYVPAVVAVTLGILGFCNVDVKPDGPVQLYVTPGVAVELVRNNVESAHTGELLLTIGTAGVVSTATNTVALSIQPFRLVITL